MNVPLTSELQKLDDFLYSEAVDDDAMLLSELDGFLAGVIVCPELIRPSEWLSLVWGEEAPDFADEEQAQTILDLVMQRYNDAIRQLNQGCYAPVYSVDEDDSPLWEFWVEGFCRAMLLRPEAWQAYYANEEDDGVLYALFILTRLAEMAGFPGEYEPMEIDEQLEDHAGDLIPYVVATLHQASLAIHDPPMRAHGQARRKVGRNDPCPCGSGKKFKKCCMNRPLA